MTNLARFVASSLAFLTFMSMGLLPAHADAVYVKDRVGDVSLTEYVTGTEGSEHARKTAAGMDAKGFRLSHGKNYVSVKIVFKNLKSSQTEFLVNFSTENSEDSEYWIRVRIRRTAIDATVKKTDSGHEHSSVCGPSAPEPGNQYTIRNKTDYGKAGYMVLYIPRYCLGYPKKVRASGGSILSDSTGLYTDDVPDWNKGFGWTKYMARG